MRLGLLLLLLAAPAGAFTADDVPSPRPEGWVVDLTGTLTIDTVTELNRLSDEIKARTGAELAVAVIPSTGGADPHDFAAHLFKAWGLGEPGKGKPGKNNGVLVFTALDDQAAEIILGGSAKSSAGVRESEAILKGEILSRFRGGDPAAAIRNGAQACAARILGVDLPTAAPAPEEVVVSSPAAPAPAVQPKAEGGDFLFPLVWGLLGTCLATLATLFRPRRRRARPRAVPVETGTVPLQC
jgi:uncharacterized protein